MASLPQPLLRADFDPLGEGQAAVGDAIGRSRSAYRVLIVDDRPDLRGLLRTRLNSESDIEVVGEASNGEEAVRLTRALTPSAVVLDLDMPVMRGDEAIPLMREAAPAMGILLLTGTVHVIVAEESAPDVIVGKGVPLAEVVLQLRALLEWKSLFEVMPLAT